MKATILIAAVVLLAGAAVLTMSVRSSWKAETERQYKLETATAQVARWVQTLDSNTNSAGVYLRAANPQLPENDPWGTPVQVSYSQGGVAERVVVSSAGPDRTFGTKDDISQSGMAVNFKGLGNAIKDNVEETARRSSRGVIQGVKEGLKRKAPDSQVGGGTGPTTNPAASSPAG